MSDRFQLAYFLGCLAVGFAVGCGRTNEQAPDPQSDFVVATLTKEQMEHFKQQTEAKALRTQEMAVCRRILAEKQGELNGFVKQMAKEFGMLPDRSYTYEPATQSLFLLSTNEVDEAGQPLRSLFRKVKTEGEAQFVASLMVARALTERQIKILAQLCEEKRSEGQQTDTLLRQAYKLDPRLSYRLDEKTGRILLLEAGKPSAQAASNAKPAK